MLTDRQVRRLRRLDLLGISRERIADRVGIDPKTARRYRVLGLLPSEVRRMDRDYRTRDDPFADVWPAIEQRLRLQPGLQGRTLFAELQRTHPGRFADGQLRTLQRRIKRWRALEGPAKEVFFAQVHHPGRLCASDFTHCSELGVTINGMPFDHLIYHFVLTYSNWEAGTVCFAESFESLSEGMQNALWELGGVPQQHRTDRLTAAVPPGTEGAVFTDRYGSLLRHYGLMGQSIQAGCANENGDAEQSHHRLKRALEQALMLRENRDFDGRAEYEAFLRRQFSQLNAGRRARLAEELPLLNPLPAKRLEACRRSKARVDTSSTIHVGGNTYSVPSRLIGEEVEVRIHVERVEVWYAQKKVESLPRLRGKGKHRIEYRHVIDWLVRKPGAFADYRYRADLFPSSRFRLAFDVLTEQRPSRASKEYVHVLNLAAKEGEDRVGAALGRVLDGGGVPGLAEVEVELNRENIDVSRAVVSVGCVDLASYDALLDGREAGDDEVGCGSAGDAGGLPEGVAPARVPFGLRGVGTSGSTGVIELRAVPVGSGVTGVSGASESESGTTVARLETAAGEELVGTGSETSAVESGAADACAAGGFVRGPA